MDIEHSNLKDSVSKSPSKMPTRILRPTNGPAKSPVSFKQLNPRSRPSRSANRTNENLNNECSGDEHSTSVNYFSNFTSADLASLVINPFKDFVMNNGSLNPSPLKAEFRGFTCVPDRFSRKPFESPFVKLCENLSPLQSRIQTPISHLKTDQMLNKFPFNSPMFLSKLEEPQSPFSINRRHIQKLDFSFASSGTAAKEEAVHNEENYDADECSHHEGTDAESNENHSDHHYDHRDTSPQYRRDSLECNDESLSMNANSNQSFKFNLRFQKSKYSASNPFPVNTSGSQGSKYHSHSHSQNSHNSHRHRGSEEHHCEEKYSIEKMHCKVEESPSSPVRKAQRRLYMDSLQGFSTETAHTAHTAYPQYSDRSHRCGHGHGHSHSHNHNHNHNHSHAHSHGTNSHTASVAKRLNDEDPEESGSVSSSNKKTVTCNCKKSKCLKLYCDCFAAGELCGPECNCCNCHNSEDHNDERNNAILSVLDRNPAAFRPKVDKLDAPIIVNEGKLLADGKVRHNKGCNCKKSGCLKKYCECYAAGVKCSELCKCETCKNMDQSTLMKKAQSLQNMVYLNSSEKSRRLSQESHGECDSCCSHSRHLHDEDEEEEEDDEPEYRSGYVGQYSSKKTKTIGESPNMIGEMMNKRSMRLREITPSKRGGRQPYQDTSSAETESAKSSRKNSSAFRTPFPASNSSKKINFSQYTPSPNKNHPPTHERNLRNKQALRPYTGDYHVAGHTGNIKMKNEY